MRVISCLEVGLDSIDLKPSKEYGVKIINKPIAPAVAVAEHTLAIIFTLLKHITVYNQHMKKCDLLYIQVRC